MGYIFCNHIFCTLFQSCCLWGMSVCENYFLKQHNCTLYSFSDAVSLLWSALNPDWNPTNLLFLYRCSHNVQQFSQEFFYIRSSIIGQKSWIKIRFLKQRFNYNLFVVRQRDVHSQRKLCQNQQKLCYYRSQAQLNLPSGAAIYFKLPKTTWKPATFIGTSKYQLVLPHQDWRRSHFQVKQEALHLNIWGRHTWKSHTRTRCFETSQSRHSTKHRV